MANVNLTLVGLASGVGAAVWTLGVPVLSPASLWSGLPVLDILSPRWELAQIASDIVQAFAILAGLVVQVITLVAMVFSPGNLSPERVTNVTLELDKMQRQLLALFGIYVVTLVVALAAKLACADDHHSMGGAVALAGSAFMVCFSLGRTAEMGKAIMSVHRLRSQLLIAQANQDARRPRVAMPIEPDPTPEAYGNKAGKR